jgi:hypothetical protein
VSTSVVTIATLSVGPAGARRRAGTLSDDAHAEGSGDRRQEIDGILAVGEQVGRLRAEHVRAS